MFDNCIFDLYGTLVDIRTDEDSLAFWTAFSGFLTSLGAEYTPLELKKTYFSYVEQAQKAAMVQAVGRCEAHPEIKIEPVFEKLLKEKGLLPDQNQIDSVGHRFRELSTVYIKLYDGVPEMLEALRKAGKKIWLLSNAQRLFTAYEMDLLGMTEQFDGIYLSSDYGVKKPDAEFFSILLREQKLDPKVSVMVGNDAQCDIAGAKGVGLSTVYIHSNISPKEPLPEANLVLKTMDITKVQKFLLRPIM